MGYSKYAESSAAFCMHTPFGNYLTVEMGKFFYKPVVFEKNRASIAGCKGIGVVGDRNAGLICKESLFHKNVCQ